MYKIFVVTEGSFCPVLIEEMPSKEAAEDFVRWCRELNAINHTNFAYYIER